MQCYKNLSESSQRSIKFCLLYIWLLVILNTYCIVAIVNFVKSWYLITILVCNFLNLFHFMLQIWYIVHYNDSEPSMLFITFGFTYHFFIIIASLLYIEKISSTHAINYFEFSIFIIYAMVILLGIFYIFILLISCLICNIKNKINNDEY